MVRTDFPMRIETERLLLVPLSMQWKEEIFREFTPEVTVFMMPKTPTDISETEEFIRSTEEKMKKEEEIVFVILLRSSGDFLGCVGLHEMNTKTPEFGIWLKKSAHGNRYGREAVTAIKKEIDRHLSYDYLVYPVDRDNIASRKIPESLGGTVHASYDKKTFSGGVLHTVEYRIFPPERV